MHLRPDGSGGFYSSDDSNGCGGYLLVVLGIPAGIFILAVLLVAIGFIVNGSPNKVSSGATTTTLTRQALTKNCEEQWGNLSNQEQQNIITLYEKENPSTAKFNLHNLAMGEYIGTCTENAIRGITFSTTTVVQQPKETTCATKWASLSPTEVQDQIDLFAKDHQDLRGPQMPEYTKNNYIETCIKTG